MPGKLRSYVHVRDAKGATHVYGPDDEIPDWAAARITNPKAWAQAPEPQPAAPGQGDPAGCPARNATRELWAAYAAVRGLEFPPGASRDQIIAAVDAAEQQ